VGEGLGALVPQAVLLHDGDVLIAFLKSERQGFLRGMRRDLCALSLPVSGFAPSEPAAANGDPRPA